MQYILSPHTNSCFSLQQLYCTNIYIMAIVKSSNRSAQICSSVLSKLIWFTAKVQYFSHVFYISHLLTGSQFFVCFLLIHLMSFDNACCTSWLSTFKITCGIDSLSFSWLTAEAYLRLWQTSMIKRFCENWKLVTVFPKIHMFLKTTLHWFRKYKNNRGARIMLPKFVLLFINVTNMT